MPGITAPRSFDNTTISNANAAFETPKMSSDMSGSWKYLVDSLERMKRGSSEHGRSRSRKEHTCDDSPNKNLCLPKSYSKFELPFTDSVNVVEIGIDIIDVLRINDKVSSNPITYLIFSTLCFFYFALRFQLQLWNRTYISKDVQIDLAIITYVPKYAKVQS